MKRFTIILLTLIYALSATGVSAERFYCCGKLAHTSFTIGDSGNSENNKGKADHCCKTTKQSFKIKDQHVGEKTYNPQTKAFVALLPAVPEFQFVAFCVIPQVTYQTNAPPKRQQTQIYILNCTYLI